MYMHLVCTHAYTRMLFLCVNHTLVAKQVILSDSYMQIPVPSYLASYVMHLTFVLVVHVYVSLYCCTMHPSSISVVR